jgi:hypothetical protein
MVPALSAAEQEVRRVRQGIVDLYGCEPRMVRATDASSRVELQDSCYPEIHSRAGDGRRHSRLARVLPQPHELIVRTSTSSRSVPGVLTTAMRPHASFAWRFSSAALTKSRGDRPRPACIDVIPLEPQHSRSR